MPLPLPATDLGRRFRFLRAGQCWTASGESSPRVAGGLLLAQGAGKGPGVRMRRRSPRGPTTAPGHEGEARGSRRRGRGLGEAEGCGLETRGREESRQKRRMVARASGRAEAETDQMGEASRAGKARRRRGESPRCPVGPSDRQDIEAVKEAELPLQSGRHGKKALQGHIIHPLYLGLLHLYR